MGKIDAVTPRGGKVGPRRLCPAEGPGGLEPAIPSGRAVPGGLEPAAPSGRAAPGGAGGADRALKWRRVPVLGRGGAVGVTPGVWGVTPGVSCIPRPELIEQQPPSRHHRRSEIARF